MGSASGKSKAACLILHSWRTFVAFDVQQQYQITLIISSIIICICSTVCLDIKQTLNSDAWHSRKGLAPRESAPLEDGSRL